MRTGRGTSATKGAENKQTIEWSLRNDKNNKQYLTIKDSWCSCDDEEVTITNSTLRYEVPGLEGGSEKTEWLFYRTDLKDSPVSSTNSEIVGKWKLIDSFLPSSATISFTFNSDGTGLYSFEIFGSQQESYPYKWSLSKDSDHRIHLTITSVMDHFPGSGKFFDITVTKSTLIIGEDRYERVNDDESDTPDNPDSEEQLDFTWANIMGTWQDITSSDDGTVITLSFFNPNYLTPGIYICEDKYGNQTTAKFNWALGEDDGKRLLVIASSTNIPYRGQTPIKSLTRTRFEFGSWRFKRIESLPYPGEK